MIYLDYTVEEWLKKVPALNDGTRLCDCDRKHWRPFIARRGYMKGLECSNCGSGTWVNEDPNFAKTISDCMDLLSQ